MLRYLSTDIICFREANSFLRLKLKENCELQGQMETIAFIILEIFFAMCIWEVSPDIPQFYLGNIQSRKPIEG